VPRSIPAVLFLVFSVAGQESRPAPPPSLARVVLVGASVTHAFSALDLLSAAISGPHDEPKKIGPSSLYFDPLGIGKKQLEQAAHAGATALVALDFLFWFAYGSPPKGQAIDPDHPEAWRVERVEKALAELEAVAVPLFLGDVPDMRGASERLLDATKIPSQDTLRRVNEIVYVWAEKRPNVHVLPLGKWNSDMRAGKLGLPPAVEENARPLGADVILGADRLHPTRAGHIVLCSWLLTAMADWLGTRTKGPLLDLPAARIRAELEKALPASRPDRR
jgi:hypothetical protein